MPNPALIYEEHPDDVFYYNDDFDEEIGNTEPGNGAFSDESCEQTRVGYVPFNKVRSAIAQFVGYATCDDGPPYRIRRTNPMAHPLYPWLYAVGVAVQGVSPLPNPLNANGSTSTQGPFDINNPFANYRKAKLTIRYRSLRYAIVDDTEIADPTEEYKRNVIWEGSAATQILQAENASQLRWGDTSPAVTGPPPVAAGPTVGTVVQSSQIAYLGKTKLVLSLLRWPFDYVSSEIDVPILPNFQKCVGKVNEVGMLSAVAGTLLCIGYSFDHFVFPVAPADPTRLVKGINIHVEFELFDPKRGGVTQPGPRGHNLMPWRGNAQWYPATRDGTLGGRGLIGTTDFNKMFYAHDDPATPGGFDD